jgi:general secretion pathway protein B
MSLILEALRKSEAERRRTQVPDLLAEPQAAVVPVPVATQRWPWLVLGAMVLLGAMWLVRALLPAQATSPEATADNRKAAAAEAPATTSPSPERAAPPLRRPLVVASPAATASTPATTSPPAPRPSNENVSSPIATAPPLAAPAPQPAASAATSAPPVPQSQPQANDNILRLSDLGSEERGQLPPLKLSMHMWNDVPAQRFVIIDGNRLDIGAHIGALTVADIVSDGVVLDWNGRLLKLPLR